MITSRTHMSRWRLVIGLVFTTVLLVGCYEDPKDVTLYDPGVYKGDDDPLMSRSGTEELRSTLHDRFQAVQTDR